MSTDSNRTRKDEQDSLLLFEKGSKMQKLLRKQNFNVSKIIKSKKHEPLPCVFVVPLPLLFEEYIF